MTTLRKLLLIALFAGIATGCNTIDGAGDDIEEAGDAIEDATD